MHTSSPRPTLRNLAIFCLVVLSAGWLGYGLDQALQNPPDQSLGLLLWLVLPTLALIVLRTFAGDGWQDFGWWPGWARNAPWYLLSALIYPHSALLVLGLGVALELVTVNGAVTIVWATAAGAALIPSFIKNIFEEFAWRGHLAPKVHSLGLPEFAGHLLVGAVWWAWHIPYWFFYIDRTLVQATTPASLAVFIFIALVNLLAASLVYGEIRLLTHSVWPAVLLHTVGNALVDQLVVTQAVEIASGMAWLAAPGHLSVLTALVFTALGLALRAYRRRSLAAQPAARAI
jgi:membrane protease YdiL (CAAX protease family)